MTLKYQGPYPDTLPEEDAEVLSLDSEGRCVGVDLGHTVVFSLYFPMAHQKRSSGASDQDADAPNEPDPFPFPDRYAFKLAFNQLVERRWGLERE